jgi:hypothetical protein
MAAPFDENAVTIYGQYSQFELLTSGSSMPAASASALRMYASGSKLYYFAPGASGSSPAEIATTGGGLDFTVQDADGIADFTFDGTANVTVGVDIVNLTAATTVADGDLVMIDDGAGGTLRKMTRAHFIESAALDAIDIDGGAIDGATLGANAQVTITDADMNGGTIDGVAIGASSAAAGTFTTLVAGGNVDLGDATSDTITATGRFDSDLVPSTDGARDLGASGLEWKDLYIDGVAYVDSLQADQLGAALDANSQAITNINVDSGAIDGVTIGTNSAATQVVATQFTASHMKVDNNLLVVGDLQVQGNIDSVSVTQNSLEVSDYLIIAGNSGSAANLDGGGLQLGGTKLGGSAAASVLYDHSNSALDFNIGSTTEVRLADGVFRPETDNDVDLGASGAEFKDLYLDGVAYIDDLRADALGAALDCASQAMTNINVDSGAIDGAVVGANSAAAGTFTSLDCTDGAFAVDNLDIDGATDIGAGLADADLIMVDDGAGGTNRKATMSRVMSYVEAGLDTLANNLSLSDNNITNVGDINADSLSVDDAAVGLNVDFSGANTGLGVMTLGDNLASALTIKDDSVTYMAFRSTTGQEAITMGNATVASVIPGADGVVDLGHASFEWKDLYIDGVAYLDEAQIGQLGAALDANSQAITNINVDSGAIDGAVIGANSAAAGTFTSLAAGGDVDLGDATSDTITATGRFDSDLVPSSDSARDLGTSALQFRTAYVDEVESATGVLNLTTAAGVEIAGTANAAGYLLQLPTTGDARARAWVTYSSARHKTNVKTVKNPIETVKSLRGVTYDWKGTGQADVGFIAEEVGAIVPEVVSFGHDGRAEGIDYGRLTSVLVEAMKQQQSEIEKLQSVVQNLTSEQPSLLEDK